MRIFRARTPVSKSSFKIQSRIIKKFRLWKKLIPIIILFLISSILLAQAAYCYADPQNYPSVSSLTRRRYDPRIAPQEVYSIPFFVQAHVNGKVNCEITLTSMKSVGVTWTQTTYLTSNGTTLSLTKVNMLPINDMNDLTITLNGQTVPVYLSDVNGVQSYTTNGYNLTNTNQVETIIISYNIERSPDNDFYVKIPWLFNENYAQQIQFPVSNSPIEENKSSDENTFTINFGLPFRQIVTSMSGWMDEFDNLKDYKIYANGTVSTYALFVEFPINQTFETSGNTYYFTTNFSQQNNANSLAITIIPSLNVILFFLPFIISPFYFLAVEYPIKKYNETKRRNSQVKSNRARFLRLAYTLIIPFTLYIAGNFNELLSLLSYMISVMSPIGFLALSYPIISYIVLRQTVLKTCHY